MSNEITSMLQPVMPRNAVSGPARSGSQPTVVDTSRQAQGDRVSLTDSARLLQLAESKPGTGRPGSDTGMTYSRPGDGFTGKGLEAVTTRVGVRGNDSVRETQMDMDPDSAAAESIDRLPPEVQAQRPSPSLANMMQSFYTTADMEGFDAASDLNADGVINFSDLAALRAMESESVPVPAEKPEPLVHIMGDSFFSSSGEQGFDANSDLNADGVVNFQDLAMLRSKMEGS